MKWIENIGEDSKRYSYLRDLNQGGCGTTHLFIDKIDNMIVVIKRIKLFGKNISEKKELIKEAEIMKMFDHPNIIKMKNYYIDKYKNDLIIVMEYAEGGDLANSIKNANFYINEKQIMDWFIQICLAIKHMHDRKILHRDIKAQNIFLNSINQIKLGDFGISSVLMHTNNFKNTFCGTYLYISPEIIKRKPYNFKTDIWSLGVVLYEICCLKPPFLIKRRDIRDLEDKIKAGIYEPIPSRYSDNLKNLISILLETNPDSRPSINEILNLKFIRDKINIFLSDSIKNKKEFQKYMKKEENNFLKPVKSEYNFKNYINYDKNKYNNIKIFDEKKNIDKFKNYNFNKEIKIKKKNYIKLSNLKNETNKLKKIHENEENLKESIYKKDKEDYDKMLNKYRDINESIKSIEQENMQPNINFTEKYNEFIKETVNINFNFKNYLNNQLNKNFSENLINKHSELVKLNMQKWRESNNLKNIFDINTYNSRSEYNELLFLNSLLN